MTTVHRRTDAGNRIGPSLPAPTVPDESLKNLVSDVTVLVYTELNRKEYYSEREIMGAVKNIASYPRELLNVLHETFISHAPSRGALSKLIQAGRTSNESLHECAYFSPRLTSGHPSTSVDVIRGLHYYDELPKMDNYALADQETRTKITALLNVAAAIDGVCDVFRENPLRWVGEDMRPVIKDTRIVELVLANPDKAEAVSRFVDSRLTADYDAILEVVNNDSNSLSEGIL